MFGCCKRATASASAEARQFTGAGVFSGQNHLESHQPFELEMPGLIDDTHAAATQFAQLSVTGMVSGLGEVAIIGCVIAVVLQSQLPGDALDGPFQLLAARLGSAAEDRGNFHPAQPLSLLFRQLALFLAEALAESVE